MTGIEFPLGAALEVLKLATTQAETLDDHQNCLDLAECLDLLFPVRASHLWIGEDLTATQLVDGILKFKTTPPQHNAT